MISREAKRMVLGAAAAAAIALPAVAQTAPVPPIPPGDARVWIMRVLEPGVAPHAPMVTADGTPMAISAQATMFYRDVPAGMHVFNVDQCASAVPSAQRLDLAAGQEVALQVTQLEDTAPWDCIPADVFYLSPIPARLRPYYMAQLRNLGAR
ncbi:MAG TPA: hypothetical protein VHW66_15205 [Stellaceae bacterium]|jgi:hypothetical protein|nr:hypothetical protein [Stellaceae bacterium]